MGWVTWPKQPTNWDTERGKTMELNEENKKHIDALTYEQLLRRWRNSPSGDAWFQGETGKYWGKRMAELKAKDPAGAVRASKNIG